MYKNDLIETFDYMNKGIKVDGKNRGHLLYADDLVLIAENYFYYLLFVL
jgi:hypothetical protein